MAPSANELLATPGQEVKVAFPEGTFNEPHHRRTRGTLYRDSAGRARIFVSVPGTECGVMCFEIDPDADILTPIEEV